MSLKEPVALVVEDVDRQSSSQRSNLVTIVEDDDHLPSKSLENGDFETGHTVHHSFDLEGADPASEESLTQVHHLEKWSRDKMQDEAGSDTSIRSERKRERRLSVSTRSKSRDKIFAAMQKPKGIHMRPEEIQVQINERPSYHKTVLLALQVPYDVRLLTVTHVERIVSIRSLAEPHRLHSDHRACRHWHEEAVLPEAALVSFYLFVL